VLGLEGKEDSVGAADENEVFDADGVAVSSLVRFS